jgi:transposase
VEGSAGRAAIDPKILLALWIYATLQRIGSARALAKLCADHSAYQWICGGVSVNYHTLADFRSQNGELLDRLLTESVARLLNTGLVTLNRVAHDGMRVRANAGSGSFRRQKRLEQFCAEAAEQVRALRKELDEDPGASDLRRKAARERATRERKERIEEALRQYPEVREKKMKDKDEARVSITDPDARRMHMPDGGFRPAYNVQLTTDTASQVIAGVEVIKSGSDGGQMVPAVRQLETRYQTTPSEFLTDGGFVKKEDIEQLASAPHACKVYAPVPLPKVPGKAQDEPYSSESPTVSEWHSRMATPEAKQIYKERAATAECVNALARNRGLQQFPVRGLKKVRAVVLLFALAHNLMCMARLLGVMA